MAFWKTEKAIANWPIAKPIAGGVLITGKYLPPAYVKPVQGFYSLAATFFGFYVLAQMPSDSIIMALIAYGISAYLFYRYVWLAGITQAIGRSVDVKFLSDAIHVRHLFSSKKYSRAVPIEFRVDRHQK